MYSHDADDHRDHADSGKHVKPVHLPTADSMSNACMVA